MYYKVYFNVDDFEFWCGASDVINLCEENDWMDELEEVLEEEFFSSSEIPTDVEINDFVRDEALDRVEAIVKSRTDDEDEDEEE